MPPLQGLSLGERKALVRPFCAPDGPVVAQLVAWERLREIALVVAEVNLHLHELLVV